MSIAVSKFKMEESHELDDKFEPVTVGLEEAQALAHVALMRDVVGKDEEVSADLMNMPFEEASIFYAPFHPESYFMVDTFIGAVTFERSLTTVSYNPDSSVPANPFTM
jgi:hypothetical protein